MNKAGSRSGEVTLVLVEDDSIDAEALRRALRKKQVELPFHHVQNGMQALNLLRGCGGEVADEPRVLILDLNTPLLGGIELLRKIRQDEALRSTVVFVLSTSSDERDLRAAYDLNVAGYLVKDGRQESLLEIAEMLKIYCERVTF